MKLETSDWFYLVGILFLIIAICMAALGHKHDFFVFLVGVAFSVMGWTKEMLNGEAKNRRV